MKLEVPEQKHLIHSMTMPIRWGDMDIMGHVNNAMYFRYMESARTHWLVEKGIPLDPKDEALVLLNTFCNFMQQLEFPGDAIVRTYVGPIGRTSFDVYHEISRTDQPDKICANGGATLVWVDCKAQKSLPIPDHLRALLFQSLEQV